MRATKRLGVAAAPEALVVHLKRFGATIGGGVRGFAARKITRHAAFPLRLEGKLGGPPAVWFDDASSTRVNDSYLLIRL